MQNNDVLDLLIELASDPEKQERFSRDPDDVLNETKLSEAHKAALRSGERLAVYSALYGEGPSASSSIARAGAAHVVAVTVTHNVHVHVHVEEDDPFRRR